jgi:hypothetical protein
MARNHAACESARSPITGSRPVRIRCQAATTAGISVISRKAFRRVASGSMDAASGSSRAAHDTAVRSTSSGWPSRGSVRSSATIGAANPRVSES